MAGTIHESFPKDTQNVLTAQESKGYPRGDICRLRPECMQAHEAGNHSVPARVDDLAAGMFFFKPLPISHRNDAVPPDDNPPIIDNPILGIDRQDKPPLD